MKSKKSAAVVAAPAPVIPRRTYVDIYLRTVFNQIEANREYVAQELTYMLRMNDSGARNCYKLESSMDVFQRSTMRKAMEALVAFAWAREGDVTMQDLHDFAITNLLQVGRGGCRSTSPTNNLCMQLVAEAWAALAADTNMGKVK